MFLNEDILTPVGYTRLKFLIPYLNKLKERKSRISVLEIGCGSGNFLEYMNCYLPNIEILKGVDLNNELIDIAKKKGMKNVTSFISGDALTVLEREEEYDVIFLLDVLEHIENDKDYLCEVKKRFLKRKGFLIFSVPAHRYLWSFVDELTGHYRRYSKKDIENLTDRLGLRNRVIYSMGIMTGILSPFFLSHLKKVKSGFKNEVKLTMESAINHIPHWYKKGYCVFKYFLPISYAFDSLTKHSASFANNQFMFIGGWF